MSTQLYAFKAHDNADLIVQVYMVRQQAEEQLKKWGMILERNWSEGVEVQAFNTETAGIVWRVLESGYGIKNWLWKRVDEFPQCNYDDRTDIPEEDLPNLEVAEEVDVLIAKEDYKIIPIVAEGKVVWEPI